MPDKRKAPARRNLSSSLCVETHRYVDEEKIGVRLSQKIFGTTIRLLFDRSAARKLRDWLNWYLEYVAEVEATPERIVRGWVIPFGSAACHYFGGDGHMSGCGSYQLGAVRSGPPLSRERFAPVCQACASVADKE